VTSLPEPVRRFLDEQATQRRLSPRTVEAYEQDLARLAQFAAGSPLERLSHADARSFAARLRSAGLAPVSIARTLSAWRSFYRWLAAQQQIQANPLTGVRAPKRPQRLPKALAPDEAVRFAGHETDGAALALRDRAIVELLYSSGLRLSELVSLDWRPFAALGGEAASRGWIDLDAGEVTVTGKGAKTRAVPVGAAALDAVRGWLAVRASAAGPAGTPHARALFVSARGSRLSARSVQQRLALLGRRLGLGVHVHPHVLRHSMASHVLQSSGDLRAVQELLGHANIATTQIYTRLDWQHLAQSYDAAHPRARGRPGSEAGSQAGSRAGSRPESRAASKVGNNVTSKVTSNATSKVTSKVGRKAGGKGSSKAGSRAGGKA
jgi:integrase/recombinase XerC